MSKISKIALFLVILNGVIFTALADRGVGKNKKKITLNIATTTNTSFSNTLSFNLKNGLKYKGSLLSNIDNSKTPVMYNTLVTYQKGNTVYIVPFKQKMVVSETKQGYSGMKLIIKPKL